MWALTVNLWKPAVVQRLLGECDQSVCGTLPGRPRILLAAAAAVWLGERHQRRLHNLARFTVEATLNHDHACARILADMKLPLVVLGEQLIGQSLRVGLVA